MNLKKTDLIATIQQEILDDLDKNILLTQTKDIGVISENIDNELVHIIKTALLEISPFWLSNSHKVFGDIYSLIIDNDKYSIIVQQNLLRPSTIEVGIINRELWFSNLNNIEENFILNNCGKYNKLSIFFPKEILTNINLELIKELIEAIISTSYKWLGIKIKQLIKSDYIVTQRIYDYLRTVFSNPELVEKIWLFSSYKKKSFYLLDPVVIEKMIKQFEPLSQKNGISPIKILSEIINKRLEFNLTASEIVVNANETKDFKLSKLDYSDNNTLFSQAEIILFGEDAVTGIPIETTGKIKLVAGIPVKYKSVIEPIINSHREKLRTEFKLTQSRLGRLYRTVTNTKAQIDMGQLGQFIGGMIKGLN